MYRVDVSIKGVKPLLMHRHPLPEEAQPDLVKEQTGVPTNIQDWEAEYELSKYKTEAGELYMPATAIAKCLQTEALDFRIPGKGKKTYKSLVKGAVFVDPQYIIHENQDCVPDRQWVRIGTARIVRTRARLDIWSLSFSLIVSHDQLPDKALNDILVQAGQIQGLGDYRPMYGTFQVTKFMRLPKEK